MECRFLHQGGTHAAIDHSQVLNFKNSFMHTYIIHTHTEGATLLPAATSRCRAINLLLLLYLHEQAASAEDSRLGTCCSGDGQIRYPWSVSATWHLSNSSRREQLCSKLNGIPQVKQKQLQLLETTALNIRVRKHL